MLSCTLCNAAGYTDAVESHRYIITIVKLILPFELDPNGSGIMEPEQYPDYEQYLTTVIIESAVLQNIIITFSTRLF